MIIFGLFMLFFDSGNMVIILGILELGLFIRGIYTMIYYFTMARYMVGGIYIFYKGMFFLDAGLFTMFIDDFPKQYVVIYLVVTIGFSGLATMLHALEIRRMHSGKWRYQFALGLAGLVTAVASIWFGHNMLLMTRVYSIWVINLGLHRIASAFRRTAVVYIQ